MDGEGVRDVIVKRTGEIVPFDPSKIEEAVKKAILVRTQSCSESRERMADVFVSWYFRWNGSGSPETKFVANACAHPSEKTKARSYDFSRL